MSEPATEPTTAPSPRASSARPSGVPVWAGLVTIAAGFGLLVLGWGTVASKVDLDDQLAPLVAAGLGGLAVVVIGLAVLNAAVAGREDDDHRRQLAQLVDVLDELKEALVVAGAVVVEADDVIEPPSTAASERRRGGARQVSRAGR